MARQLNKLTTRTLAGLKEPGRYSDGGGLYLSISANGGRRWVFLYTRDGKTREMGLGSAADGQVALAEARRKAQDARDALATGKDPLGEKRAAERAKAAAAVPTFGDFADQYLADMKSAWRNEKHKRQWEYTLRDLAAPLRNKRVNEIDTAAVLLVLKPLWQRIPETASRLRGRLEAVLDAAKAQGLREGDNPARWRGHLRSILPARQKLTRGHHRALSYEAIPDFMKDLRSRPALSARALEFLTLTACRTSEVVGARWNEIDTTKRLWVIPGARMKAGHAHRVPLSDRAMAILGEMEHARIGEYVFPGNTARSSLSSMAMLTLLKRMKVNATAHGMRAAFRDWCAEQTSFPHQTAEHALAHRISDKAESAYRRGDELEKRRQLMAAWAQYCGAQTAKVIPLATGRSV